MIVSKKIDFERIDRASPELQGLIRRLLHTVPEKRLGGGPSGADEIKRHPFFRDISWEDVYSKKLPPPVANKRK